MTINREGLLRDARRRVADEHSAEARLRAMEDRREAYREAQAQAEAEAAAPTPEPATQTPSATARVAIDPPAAPIDPELQARIDQAVSVAIAADNAVACARLHAAAVAATVAAILSATDLAQGGDGVVSLLPACDVGAPSPTVPSAPDQKEIAAAVRSIVDAAALAGA